MQWNELFSKTSIYSSVLTLIIYIIVKILVAFFKHYVSDRPLEKFKAKNSSDLQVDNFYRKVSMEDISVLLEYWYDLIDDPKKVAFDPVEMKMKTFMYASERTCLIFSLYMQLVFEYSKYEKEHGIEYDVDGIPLDRSIADKLLLSHMYLAFIFTSLKYDFSNIKLDPLALIKANINDYFDKEREYRVAYDLARKNINKILNK